MPLYDCMLLIKPHIKKEAIMDLLARVGKHVSSRNGVLTEIKSMGTVQLGYGIKKLDGKYYQGQLMQMTMMATPNMNKELHYLNKEDRLLRWLLVKHRDVQFGLHHEEGDQSLSEGMPRRLDTTDQPSRYSMLDGVLDSGKKFSSDGEDDSDDEEYEVGLEANEDQSK